MTDGIDVSHWSGTINWVQVRQEGNLFAFAKATDGVGFVDSRFGGYWPAMKAAGLVRGAYHYFRVAQDAAVQADNFLNHVHLEAGDLPPVLDIEGIGNRGATNQQWIDGVRIWLERVQAGIGRRPIIYTRANFFNAHLGNNFGEYTLWIAHWGAANPTLPQSWQPTGWTFWQFAGDVAVAGVAGNGDRNHFNGEEQVLRNFANGN